MRIWELRPAAGGLEEEEEEDEGEDEQLEVVKGTDGEVVSVARRNATGARVLFYPTLLYSVIRNQLEPEFHWWDRVDEYVLLGAVPFCSDVPCLKQLGVTGVVTLNEPYETLVPRSVYQAHRIRHLQIPTRDYLFAPSMDNIDKAVDFIHHLEGYDNNADSDKDAASVEVVVRHRPIIRKTSCRVLEDHQQLGTTSEPFC